VILSNFIAILLALTTSDSIIATALAAVPSTLSPPSTIIVGAFKYPVPGLINCILLTFPLAMYAFASAPAP